jgi:hypothetical protein
LFSDVNAVDGVDVVGLVVVGLVVVVGVAGLVVVIGVAGVVVVCAVAVEVGGVFCVGVDDEAACCVEFKDNDGGLLFAC